MKSSVFTSLAYTLQADFVRASKTFVNNPNASNFNHLNETALAYQQIQWLARTPLLTPLRRDLTAKKIVMESPNEQWGKAVVDCAAELTA